MEAKTILVTGIGGNVGQGVLRNIKDAFPKYKRIGTDIEAFTAGNFLCQKVIPVPYAYEESYIESIKRIILEEKIDLIIPTTDFEVYYLSKTRKELDCPIACISFEKAEVFLDKYKTYEYFQLHDLVFAESKEISDFGGEWDEFIIKPKKGRGSRGVHISPDNWNIFDANYMVQPLLKGKEYTTTVYVNKNKKIHAIITMQRELQNGTTVQAKVVEDHQEELNKLAQSIVDTGGIMGSFNIQSIYHNKIIPFEINGRISGTNSIRHALGFQDVVWTIQEYLLQQELKKPVISKGIATRILLDTIYVNAEDESQIINTQYPYQLY